MRRILILGCPEPESSTLARLPVGQTGLPLIHLDQMYWRPGWKEPDEVLAGTTCIIEGNYSASLEPTEGRRYSPSDRCSQDALYFESPASHFERTGADSPGYGCGMSGE